MILPEKNNWKAHLALFFIALIYGANYTIAKEVLDNNFIQPGGFILLRVISGTIIFYFFHKFFVKEKVEKKDFKKLVLCGLFGVAINQLMFFTGLKLTVPINAALMMTTAPMLILIISAILIKEKITGNKIFGIIIAGAGAIFLIIYGENVSMNINGRLGDIFILINATSYGIYLVLVKSLMTKYNPLTVIKWVFMFGLLFVFPFGLNDLIDVEWRTFPVKIWTATGYVILFPTVFAYFLNAYALKKVDASVVGIYIYLQPLLATLVALWLSKDELTIQKLIAGIMILLGVFLTSKNFPNIEKK